MTSQAVHPFRHDAHRDRIEDGLARGNGADRAKQGLAANLLQQVSARSGEDGGEHGFLVWKRGEEDHPRTGMGVENVPACLHPAAVLEADVHQHDVGLQTDCFGDGVHSAGGFADDFYAFRMAQKSAQPRRTIS